MMKNSNDFYTVANIRKRQKNPRASRFAVYVALSSVLASRQNYHHCPHSLYVTASVAPTSGPPILNPSDLLSSSTSNNSNDGSNSISNQQQSRNNKPWSLWGHISGGDSDDDDDSDTEVDDTQVDILNQTTTIFSGDQQSQYLPNNTDRKLKSPKYDDSILPQTIITPVTVEIETVIHRERDPEASKSIELPEKQPVSTITSPKKENAFGTPSWPPLNPVDWSSIETDAEIDDSTSVNELDWDTTIDNGAVAWQNENLDLEKIVLPPHDKFEPQVSQKSDIEQLVKSEQDDSIKTKSMQVLQKVKKIIEESDESKSQPSRRAINPLAKESRKSQQSRYKKMLENDSLREELRLWTNREYKKQQQKLQRAQLRLYLQQQLMDRSSTISSSMRRNLQSILNSSSDSSVSDDIKAFKLRQEQKSPFRKHDKRKLEYQGLFYEEEESDNEELEGHSLPNLPVYHSDDEDDDDLQSVVSTMSKLNHDPVEKVQQVHALTPQSNEDGKVQPQSQQLNIPSEQVSNLPTSTVIMSGQTDQPPIDVVDSHQRDQRSLTKSDEHYDERNDSIEVKQVTPPTNSHTTASVPPIENTQPTAPPENTMPGKKIPENPISIPDPRGIPVHGISSNDPQTFYQSHHPRGFYNRDIPNEQNSISFHRYEPYATYTDPYRVPYYNPWHYDNNTWQQHPMYYPFHEFRHPEFVNSAQYSATFPPVAHYNYTSEYHLQPRHPFTGMPLFQYMPPPQVGYPNVYPPPYIPYQFNSYAQHSAQFPYSPEQRAMWNTQPQFATTKPSNKQIAIDIPFQTPQSTSQSVSSVPPSIEEPISVSSVQNQRISSSISSSFIPNSKVQQVSTGILSKQTALSEVTTRKNPVDVQISSPWTNLVADTSNALLPVQKAIVGAEQTFAEATSNASYGSLAKISIILFSAALLCYSAVSPRTSPLTEYNLRFFENIRIFMLATVGPLAMMWSVFDARYNNGVNSVVNTFFFSFSIGYILTFAVEIFATTGVRLAVFQWLESDIFKQLSPRVPIFIIPWVLREKRYRPKRITLFVADFIASCIAAPIIEEYAKLLLLQFTTTLPKNFNWITKTSSSTRRRKKRRKLVAEAVPRQEGESDIINANQYVTNMLAASLGLKLCDAGRRILLYTKASNLHKEFYAFCRGWFPIQELCGTMTALGLAKRDLLGIHIPTWRLLAPAVVIHGLSNFRGMKPFFKWNSSTPWSEMQLSPLNVADASTLPQLLKKGYAKLMWIIFLSRVIGYCIKNYYMVNRQAVKLTTTYAGKRSAFSAEIETAEVLKSQRKRN